MNYLSCLSSLLFLCLALLVPGVAVPSDGADVKDKILQVQPQPQNAEGRVAEYEREFHRQLNAQCASRGAIRLNDKVHQLLSRLKQKYPDGRSAEFRQEFLRGLKAIQRELEEQSEVESRLAEYQREFLRQLKAQGRKDK
jgi:hypothetical protein